MISDQLKQLPDAPGIYLFYNSHRELIYVGKATSLKHRVRSYFIKKRSSRPIEQMIDEVTEIKWKQTDSVLEAIILEANAIKKYLPKYNVLGKDSKSWNYIVMTTDPYPQVRTLRQHDFLLLAEAEKIRMYSHVFGPYPGLNTKATMKLLRQLFGFSTCKPQSGRPCLYYQMGQCLGVCVGAVSVREYMKQAITPLVWFLQGKKKILIRLLEKRMSVAAKQEQFETAARIRNQIQSLTRIHDIALLNTSFFSDEFVPQGRQVRRIEGYDISNLGATGKVGSMVVFDSAGPTKAAYRKFNIKTVEGQSDVDCLEEVLVRRLAHPEWPYPDLWLIDGGKPQVNRAKQVLRGAGVTTPIVGIAKGPERKKNEFVFADPESHLVAWVHANQQLLIRVRDEAHRFAITFQRSLRNKRT